MDILAISGFLITIIVMILLVKGYVHPSIAFILVPLAFCVVCGFGADEIQSFVKSGIGAIQTTAVMFTFSVIYFSIMSDMGLFEPIVQKLLPKGNVVKLFPLFVGTYLTAIISHFDGAAATTWIVTVSAFKPIYDKLGLSRYRLATIISCAVATMNILPWGGPAIRAATVIGIDVNDMYKYIIPSQIVMFIISIGICYVMSKVEERKGFEAKDLSADEDAGSDSKEKIKITSPRWIVNAVLTVVLVGVLFSGKFSSYICFMIATSVALLINFPNVKEQKKRLQSYSSQAMAMVLNLFAVAVFLGVMDNSGMVEEMAGVLLNLIPSIFISHAHWILCLFGPILMIAIHTDPYYYSLLPVVLALVTPFGKNPTAVAATFLITGTWGTAMHTGAGTLLGLGLADVEIGTHIKSSIGYLWPAAIITLIISTIIGVVVF